MCEPVRNDTGAESNPCSGTCTGQDTPEVETTQKPSKAGVGGVNKRTVEHPLCGRLVHAVASSPNRGFGGVYFLFLFLH